MIFNYDNIKLFGTAKCFFNAVVDGSEKVYEYINIPTKIGSKREFEWQDGSSIKLEKINEIDYKLI